MLPRVFTIRFGAFSRFEIKIKARGFNPGQLTLLPLPPGRMNRKKLLSRERERERERREKKESVCADQLVVGGGRKGFFCFFFLGRGQERGALWSYRNEKL